MIRYTRDPAKIYDVEGEKVCSFIEKDKEENIDWDTVKSFGTEWQKFKTFADVDLDKIGADYFDLVDPEMLKGAMALDVGCGSGRWARYLSSRVRFIEAIDPSESIFSATRYLRDFKNVRTTQANVWHLPFEPSTFDFVYSLGVLHHLPDTAHAVENCVRMVKPGGWFLVYLYYDLDGRSFLFRTLFAVSTRFRWVISRMPFAVKSFLCDGIALFVYLPFSLIARCMEQLRIQGVENFPLAYYRKTSFYIMRNDALDRFGTPLEKRFSKSEILKILTDAGLTQITFSKNPPFWHVLSQKPF